MTEQLLDFLTRDAASCQLVESDLGRQELVNRSGTNVV
jgi:hypothetical protein